MNHLRAFFTATIISLVHILSFAQMDTPDFAYPKTVAKRADSDLKEAVKNHDPHAAINALMRMYAANEIIDPETRQKSKIGRAHV